MRTCKHLETTGLNKVNLLRCVCVCVYLCLCVYSCNSLGSRWRRPDERLRPPRWRGLMGLSMEGPSGVTVVELKWRETSPTATWLFYTGACWSTWLRERCFIPRLSQTLSTVIIHTFYISLHFFFFQTRTQEEHPEVLVGVQGRS